MSHGESATIGNFDKWDTMVDLAGCEDDSSIAGQEELRQGGRRRDLRENLGLSKLTRNQVHYKQRFGKLSRLYRGECRISDSDH
jgi:hypothetical protein